MANKYSKGNKSAKAQEEKSMKSYEESRKKLNKGARVMAIIMVAIMVIFAIIGSVSFLF